MLCHSIIIIHDHNVIYLAFELLNKKFCLTRAQGSIMIDRREPGPDSDLQPEELTRRAWARATGMERA